MFLTDVLSHSNAGYLDEQGKFQTFFKDGVLCHFVASMFSGLVTTTASMPVDIAKTRSDFVTKKNSKNMSSVNSMRLLVASELGKI